MRRVSGFTFVEIIFVTLVLGILLAASVPRFQQTAQRLRAEQAAFELTALLRVAHEQAVAQGGPIVWMWDAEARSARLLLMDETGQLAPLSGRINRSTVFPEEILVSATQDHTPVDRVTFFPDGTSDSAAVAVALRGRVYTITVDATTSQVALSPGLLTR